MELVITYIGRALLLTGVFILAVAIGTIISAIFYPL